MAENTYKAAGVDLEKYADAMARLPRLMHRTFTPRGRSERRRIRRAVSTRFRRTALFPQIRRACARLVHRRRGDEAQSRRHRGAARYHRPRPCRHVRQRCDLHRRRTAVFPRLHSHEPRRPSADRTDCRRDFRPPASSATAPWSGAKRRSCPTCIPKANTTWPAFASPSWKRNGCSTVRTLRRGDAVIGLASSGVHSNGYSLVRKIVFDHAGLAPGEHIEGA